MLMGLVGVAKRVSIIVQVAMCRWLQLSVIGRWSDNDGPHKKVSDIGSWILYKHEEKVEYKAPYTYRVRTAVVVASPVKLRGCDSSPWGHVCKVIRQQAAASIVQHSHVGCGLAAWPGQHRGAGPGRGLTR